MGSNLDKRRKAQEAKRKQRRRKRLSPTAMEAQSESGFAKALHAIQTPLYITAGMIDEVIKREQGKRPTSYGDILKESGANLIPWLSDERRRVTYGDFVDNPYKAFALDVFADPINLVPYAAATKAIKGVGVLSKVATKLPFRAVDKALGVKTTRKMEQAFDAVRRHVDPKADVRRMGGKQLEGLREKQYREAGEKMRELGVEIEDKIGKIVPDYERQAVIYDLVERRPLLPKGKRSGLRKREMKPIGEDPEFLRWQSEVMGLTGEERAAYKAVVRIQDGLEDLKVEAGVLNRARAEGFRKKFGIQYLPHMRATREHFTQVGEDFLDGIRRGDKASLERATTYKLADGQLAGDVKDGIKKVEDSLERALHSVRGEKQIDPTVVDKIRKSAGFINPRYRPGTALELGDVNMDIAAVLGLESAEVAKAFAIKKHQEALDLFARSRNWIFDNKPLEHELAERFGKKEADRLMRDGFEVIGGKWVPKTIAREWGPVHKAYTDPGEIEKFFKTYKKVQNIWKAWTLSIFPAYHSRNAISNMWNNFLAGMGPTATHHYMRANHLMWKYKRGTLDADGLKIMDEARRMRVLDEGWYVGELGSVMEGAGKYSTLVQKMYHPAHNPALKFGYATGRLIEDHARLSHYLWAKNGKGMSAADAAKSVNKYLFDYRYGLTPTEQKVGRDFLFPFIAWTRFNLPLQAEMMLTKPKRFVVMPKSIRGYEQIQQHLSDDYGTPEAADIFMADWMKRATKVKLRYNKDKEADEYFILDQWLPSADIGKLFDKTAFGDMVVSLLSPGVKLPIEILKNYNLFQKRPIREYKGQKKKLLGIPMYPELEHAARSIRLLNESDRIIEGFFREDGDMSGWAAFLRGITGKAYPYAPEKQKKRWQWDIGKRISRLKYMQKREEKQGNMNEAGVIAGVIEELEAEREYFKKIKVTR